jgi:hypothetical protein
MLEFGGALGNDGLAADSCYVIVQEVGGHVVHDRCSVSTSRVRHFVHDVSTITARPLARPLVRQESPVRLEYQKNNTGL